jgi:hypothetical protein
MEKWQQHLENQKNPEEAEKAGLWASLLTLPEEILTAEDPLKAILDLHGDEV